MHARDHGDCDTDGVTARDLDTCTDRDGLPRVIEGLPGQWGGIGYDFVTGAGDSGFPGLADALSECLIGT